MQSDQPTDGETEVSSVSTVLRRSLLALSLPAAVAAALVFPFPMEGRLWGEIFNLAHAPAFCIVLLFVAGIPDPPAIGLPSVLRTVLPMTWRRVLLSAAILMIMGIVCEFLQQFAGRNTSLSDVAANSVGIIAGLLWILSRRRQGNSRHMIVALAASLMIAVSVPSALHAWDCIQQIKSFPLIASFERSHELGGWRQQSSSADRTTEWATDGEYSMKATLLAQQYPSVAMYWFTSDWRAYQTFAVDLRNPGAEALRLFIKLNDRQHKAGGFEVNDRFQQEVTVPPDSQQTVVIDLADVQAAPATRKMDMSDMSMIEIFAVSPDEPVVIYIDNIRLLADTGD